MRANPFWVVANDGKYQCINDAVYVITAATIAMVQDFIVCILPLTLIMGLNIPKRKKWALMGMFAVGFFLCIMAVLRMVWIVRFYYEMWDL